MEQKQIGFSYNSFGSIGNTLKQSGCSMRVTTNKKEAKKKLDYNSREISSLLLNAGHSQTATTVLLMAKSRLANLKRLSVTGDYDKTAVRNAITHATRMVLCAQTKVRHLKEEEAEKQQEKKEEASMSKKYGRDKFSVKKQQLKLKKQQLEIKRKCRRHRNEERAKINAANGEYEGKENKHERGVALSDISERLILEEIRTLEMEEQREKAVGAGGVSTAGSGNGGDSGSAIDVSVGDEMGMSAAAEDIGVDISI